MRAVSAPTEKLRSDRGQVSFERSGQFHHVDARLSDDGLKSFITHDDPTIVGVLKLFSGGILPLDVFPYLCGHLGTRDIFGTDDSRESLGRFQQSIEGVCHK